MLESVMYQGTDCPGWNLLIALLLNPIAKHGKPVFCTHAAPLLE
jgi:hypothetical protein